MKTVGEVFNNYSMDLTKRIAKMFAHGDITKQDFDAIYAHLESIRELIEPNERGGKVGRKENIRNSERTSK